MSTRAISPRHYALLGLAIFVYTLLISVFVQFILLPIVLPAWHAGNGLLAGGDMPTFHRLAVELAEKIQSQGWSVWELRPAGQAPAGIAAALYYVMVPEPWTMIPVYAALHAMAGVLLARILLQFDQRWTVVVLGTLPLILYPSAAMWFSQLGKDSFSIAGYLAIVLGWVTLVGLRIKPRLRRIISAPVLILGGAGLVWIVRPYLLEILWVLYGPAALAVTFLLARYAAKHQLRWQWAGSGIAVAWLIFVALSPGVIGRGIKDSGGIQFESPGLASGPPPPLSELGWRNSGWLPDAVEDRLRALTIARLSYTTGYPEAGSNVDVDTTFHQASDVGAYLPRAAVIAFIYPTPIDWFHAGTLPQNTLMRQIAGLEMTGVYLALVMLPYAIWRWRTRSETWLILLFSVGMMLVLALVVANVGTLYRMRYPYLMSLVGFSFAAATALYLDWRARSANVELGAARS